MTSPHQWVRSPLGLALAVCGLLWAGTVRSAPITYHVTVNTSSIKGINFPPGGSFDTEFNPGANSLAATATITNFQSNGTLVATDYAADNSGAVVPFSGPGVPSPVSVSNTTAFNDYVQNFNFGTSLSFDVTFSGPAVNTPNPSAGGSLFALTLWDSQDASGNFLLPSNDPFAPIATLVININSNGTTSSFVSPQATATQVVPEPSTLLLLGAGVLAAAGWRRRRRAA